MESMMCDDDLQAVIKSAKELVSNRLIASFEELIVDKSPDAPAYITAFAGLSALRKLMKAKSEDEVAEVLAEWRDRVGDQRN